MMVYDKAKWQIEGGIPKEAVIKHFEVVFGCLDAHRMLSDDGKEMLEFGIDSEISLNSRMVTQRGCDFLEKYYDEIIEKGGYDPEKTEELIEKFYNAWN